MTGGEESSAEVPRVSGYEFTVECPECGYHTAPEDREASEQNTMVCGEDVPGSENHGCGRELAVSIEVVDSAE